jgi:hypothetical protein
MPTVYMTAEILFNFIRKHSVLGALKLLLFHYTNSLEF